MTFVIIIMIRLNNSSMNTYLYIQIVHNLVGKVNKYELKRISILQYAPEMCEKLKKKKFLSSRTYLSRR